MSARVRPSVTRPISAVLILELVDRMHRDRSTIPMTSAGWLIPYVGGLLGMRNSPT